MTILTECPSCDAPAAFEEDATRFGGWFPCACETCGQLMWVHNVTIDGTTYSHADFLAKIVAPERRDEVNREALRETRERTC